MPSSSSPDATLLAPSPFGEAEAARWFFENAHDLFAVVTPEGRFSVVNGAWTNLTGWSPDPSQPKPARRGSGTASLSDALRTRPRDPG